MYSRGAGIVYGFHGCDIKVAEQVLNQKQPLKNSINSYDWLGNGIYFWENSPSRAKQYALEIMHNKKTFKNKIVNPTVIGSVIHLGNCLDLLDYEKLNLLKIGFEILKLSVKSSNEPLPKNKTISNNNDLLLRDLDCAVIETLHKMRLDNNLAPFDSVRGVFWEGNELYPNAGFREKDHIQICIRNPNCIKGFFRPREIDEAFSLV